MCIRDRLGRVDHRDAFLDTDTIERERGITIFSKQAQLPLGEDLEATLLDTPGHVDFSAEMERTLQAVSYTHLDVYKRQVWTCRSRCPPRCKDNPPGGWSGPGVPGRFAPRSPKTRPGTPAAHWWVPCSSASFPAHSSHNPKNNVRRGLMRKWWSCSRWSYRICRWEQSRCRMQPHCSCLLYTSRCV